MSLDTLLHAHQLRHTSVTSRVYRSLPICHLVVHSYNVCRFCAKYISVLQYLYIDIVFIGGLFPVVGLI